MKNLLALVLIACSGMAAAQRYTCEVDMVDIRTQRVIQTFVSRVGNDCFEAKKECSKERRLSGRLNTADCVEYGENNRRRPHGPVNPPREDPRQVQINNLLRLSNWDLAMEAEYGIGACQVSRGGRGASCSHYVKVNGRGYPNGSGCADSQYTYNYGCSERSSPENAGCLIRRALSRGECL